MSYSGTPTLYGEQQIAAAYQGGTRLPVVSIAVGDGNGAVVQPTEGMTALVNEVWRGAITSWGIDPNNPRCVVIHTTVPATAGPFTIREAGVIDASGGLIAVTALAATEIVAPGTSNQATALDLTIALPVGSAGAITVSPGQGERVLTERLVRTPFISINSASVATPPASPALGDLYIVPQNPQGAWATATVGTIAEWNGTFWAFIAPPLKMVAGIMDSADDSAAEYLKWNGDAWEVLATPGSIFTVTDNGTSTPDEFVGTVSPAFTALQPNMVFRFRQGAQANQTAAPKANLINAAGTALGDVPFSKADSTPLAKGDLRANADFLADWDGTSLRVIGLESSDTSALIAQQLAALRFAGSTPHPYFTPGVYSLTIPSGVYTVYIDMWGAGAGGGGATGTNAAASGGGSGAYAAGSYPVLPGDVLTITIGAGGVGGTNAPTNGSNGGTTSVVKNGSATLITCTGGGYGSAGNGGLQTQSNGGPGVGAGGNVYVQGNYGGFGILVGASVYMGGFGGAAPLGGSAPSPNVGSAGNYGVFPGGGGNGSSGNAPGGTGAPGAVIVTY